MYGNRGAGRFGNQQQGLLGNANMMMAGQMGGMANMQLLNQGGGGRDLRGGPGLFPMNPSLGMREMQQPGAGGFNVNNRMNMPSQPRDAVLDILVTTNYLAISGDTNNYGCYDFKLKMQFYISVC